MGRWGFGDGYVTAIKRLGLTQAEAAERMGLTQRNVSALFRGDFTNLSERKLMDCLNRVGYDIEIRVKPPIRRTGRLTLAVARLRNVLRPL